MKKLTEKRKQFLLKKSEEIQLRRARASLKRATQVHVGPRWVPPPRRGYRSRPAQVVQFPQVFSFIDNPVISLYVFEEIEETLMRTGSCFLDASKVKIITVDTLLYLLAFINNYRWKSKYCDISGNVPKEGSAAQVFTDSGFLKYVTSRYSSFPAGKNSVQISSGVVVDPDIARKMCEFTIDRLKMDRQGTKGLFNIIIEIITNTVQHAYDHDAAHTKWFFYAKHLIDKDEVEFTLLDTGMGIPDSMRKSILEELFKDFFNYDEKLVLSALYGEYRSQTGKLYRGKGLPTIREFCDKGYIKELYILTSRAYVGYDTRDIRSMPVAIRGTLYTWKMRKH